MTEKDQNTTVDAVTTGTVKASATEQTEQAADKATVEQVEREVDKTADAATDQAKDVPNEAADSEAKPAKASTPEVKTELGPGTEGLLTGLVLGIVITIVAILAAAFLTGDGGESDFETRLAACEEACGLATPADETVKAKAENKAKAEAETEATPAAKGAEATAAATTEVGASTVPNTKGGVDKASATPSTAAPAATSAPTKKPKATPKAKKKPLTKAELSYFTSVLLILTHGSDDPKEWASPQECARDYWDDFDEGDYYDEWLTVAAHPRTTPKLLHYLALRCQSMWIGETEDAVKLAGLILARKECDDECIEYLCESDYEEVRNLVFNKVLDYNILG